MGQNHRPCASAEVDFTTLTVGNRSNESHEASLYVRLKPKGARQMSTADFRAMLEKEFVADELVKIANPKISNYYRPGKPEFQLVVKPGSSPVYGINTKTLGNEIRAQVEGTLPAKFREKGQEYNIIKKDLNVPSDIRVLYAGTTEMFQEMLISFALSIGLGILFIYLVLASLYESFITPFAIMLALPLAICGAFVAIYVANQSLSIFALLGIVSFSGWRVRTPFFSSTRPSIAWKNTGYLVLRRLFTPERSASAPF